MNVTRTIQEFIELGLAGCHLEDQMNPKRCGHLDNKSLVSSEEMIKKILAYADEKNQKQRLIKFVNEIIRINKNKKAQKWLQIPAF